MHAGNHMGIMTTFKKPTAESPSPWGRVSIAAPFTPSGKGLRSAPMNARRCALGARASATHAATLRVERRSEEVCGFGVLVRVNHIVIGLHDRSNGIA